MSCRTVVANERKKVMYIRKHGKKWQCLVRLKGIAVSNTFFSKSEASNWGKQKGSIEDLTEEELTARMKEILDDNKLLLEEEK